MTLISRWTNHTLLMLVLLMLPIGLSSLSIAHEYETEHQAHELHQCEVYDAIHNAVVQTSFELPVIAVKAITHNVERTPQPSFLPVRPRTRSPPLV